VEGTDSRTKAKGGTGTIRDIKDIPSGETRARPEILGKHLVHSDSGTKAKGGTGTRRDIKDVPSRRAGVTTCTALGLVTGNVPKSKNNTAGVAGANVNSLYVSVRRTDGHSDRRTIDCWSRIQKRFVASSSSSTAAAAVGTSW
jgi:hypothetical protein